MWDNAISFLKHRGKTDRKKKGEEKEVNKKKK
jgi:hypothetical protein